MKHLVEAFLHEIAEHADDENVEETGASRGKVFAGGGLLGERLCDFVRLLGDYVEHEFVRDALFDNFEKSPCSILYALAGHDQPRVRRLLADHLKKTDMETQRTCAELLVRLGDKAGPRALARVERWFHAEEKRAFD